jgi:phosphomannomutase
MRRFDSRQFVSPMEPEQLVDIIIGKWPDATSKSNSSIHEVTWPDGWRVLVRRSGTEPLTRCYVEGPNKLYNWFSDNLPSH